MNKPTIKPLVLLIALVLLLAGTAAAPPPEGEAEGVSYLYPIQVDGDGEYKAVQLGADVYTLAAAGLVNLRVLDTLGNPVPYFLYDTEAFWEVENAVFPGEIIHSYQENGDKYQDFHIFKSDNEDVYGNSLLLYTDFDGFAKEVTVWGSHDGNVWTELTSAQVFRVEGRAQLEIPFETVEKYDYYRVRVPNAAEDIYIASVELRYRKAVASSGFFEDSISPAFQREEADSVTRITVPAEALRGLRLTGLDLETASMFQREVRTPLARDTLYNLTFQDKTLSSTHLELPGSAWGDTPFVLEISNGDDTPIAVDSLTFYYRCDLAVFKAAPGEEYYLALDAGATTAPRYDIAGYAELILSQGVDVCGYGEARAITKEAEEQALTRPFTDTWIFHGMLIAASVVLILLIVRTAMRKNGDTPGE